MSSTKASTPEKKVRKGRGRLVAVRFSALGDVAMTIPALYTAARQNPEREIVMLTRKAFTPIFVNPPENLHVIGADLKGEHSGVTGLMKLLGQVKPHTLVDLHDVLRTWILRIGMHARLRTVVTFDKARAAKSRLVAHGATAEPAVTPTIQRYADALRRAGLRMDGYSFDHLYDSIPADSSLFSALSAPKQAGEVWIGAAPFAAHQGKIYSPEHLFEALNTVATQTKARIFLFGGGKIETDMLQRWAERLPDAVCVAGAGIGFAAELALMSQLDVMVSMDSGNMHLAAITGTPVVSIWAQTHPAAGFAPWQSPSAAPHILLGDNTMKCRPCSVFGNAECRLGIDPPCRKAVTPDDVVNAIISTINHNKQ